MAGILAVGQPAPHAGPIARLSTNEFWLNLHQFLYVLGRFEARMPDRSRRAVAGAPVEQQRVLATLTEDERAIWRTAITAYVTGPSKLDAVFDTPLMSAEVALAKAGDSASLDAPGLDAVMRQALRMAAPIYRRYFWPAHRRANEAWAQDTRDLLTQYGRPILAFITRAYGLPWPADGYHVHVSAYANWAGAFSTDDNLLIISSLDSGSVGAAGLETVFHEAMHQWDSAVDGALTKAAASVGKTLSPDLSHAIVFFTAGEAVRAVVPGHVPYAEANNMWSRSMGVFKPALDAVWLPYLKGTGTRDAAFAELARMTAK